VQITSEGREQSDLTYNLQTDCGLTVVERKHSDLTYNSANYQWRKEAEQPDVQYFSLCRRPLLEGSKATWWTTLFAVVQTVVGREQSNLMDNTICSCTDHCWKEAKRPDRQHYLQLHRPLLEGSKATWWTTLSAAAQTVAGEKQSDLMDNTIYSCTDCCWKGAKRPDRQHYLLLHGLL